MSIELFEHNKTAYESAVAMLAETGKVAIIHPTGTGKSFIGFKLCEDNPEKNVCWLSPSDYIFRTQLENLKKTGAEIPQNIKFFTYAKLMYMSDDELAEIAPDMYVIDEIHRVGAPQWQRRVNILLNMYPNVPMLGLSATNVRYLDNQRDMAEELFDGNIASEMTLGEAIVRGILKAPLYISTVFSYQKELEKYERMAKMPKFKAVRDTAEKYLEALRRTIEKADGLDVIFEKYMPDKHGKYVVFCANREHLDEMLSHVSEWFSKVDKNPKVYKVYSYNPEASGEFGDWVARQRRNKSKLSDEQVKALDSIGMIWSAPAEKQWEYGFEHLVQYKNKYGTARLGADYRAEDGYTLGRWLGRQKKNYINGELNKEQIEKLTQIGVEL